MCVNHSGWFYNSFRVVKHDIKQILNKSTCTIHLITKQEKFNYMTSGLYFRGREECVYNFMVTCICHCPDSFLTHYEQNIFLWQTTFCAQNVQPKICKVMLLHSLFISFSFYRCFHMIEKTLNVIATPWLLL